jgi:protein arginine N-methyltransferase 2
MQIDSYFQALPVPPSTHVIIEPHPDVLRHMREQGWHDKKGVTVLEGKWQDFVGTEVLEGMAFDAVYTDTFSEDYRGEAQHPCHGTLTNSVAQICVNFLIMFQNSSPVQTPDLAFSTVWERQVCCFDLYNLDWGRLTTTHLDALFYDVYTHVAELHLATIGIDVEWTDVDAAAREAVRWGETQKYFSIRLYRLPVGRTRNPMQG